MTTVPLPAVTASAPRSRPFEVVLVANRGEIAVRVLRTLRRLGITSVAVYSDADAGARHVAEADLAYRLGPPPAAESYLSIERILAACAATGAQAVHPGYGFLSENAAFAAALQAAGIVFVGPSVHAIEVMGDKITAKNAVSAAGVPVVPGISRPGLTDDDLIAAAAGIGFPVLVKPSAGGGGKGMRIVEEPTALPDALVGARREARSSFGDDTLFLERFVHRPRHIEVQVLADGVGTVLHLGERECSLQRRHQKVIEEAPSVLLDPATRARIGAAACDTARSVRYTGAGTVEFLVSADEPDRFSFLEMNTRLQVEHPVTELVTGIDLVEWQLRIAAGEALPMTQQDLPMTGHAIEARVYAEDPGRGFVPTGGMVHRSIEPTGDGIRVDSGISDGSAVGSDYDPMLSKIIAYGPDRATAIERLDRALADTAVLGVGTNVDFLRHLLADPDVRAGRLDTGLLDRIVPDFTAPAVPDEPFLVASAQTWLDRWNRADPVDPWSAPSGWRLSDPAPFVLSWVSGGRRTNVELSGTPTAGQAVVDGDRRYSLDAAWYGTDLAVTIAGVRRRYPTAGSPGGVWVHAAGRSYDIRFAAEERLRQSDEHSGSAEVLSPMPGSVIALPIASGTEVTRGTPVAVVEAMKMEHTLTAPRDGVVELFVTVGRQVAVDQLLARISAGAAEAGEARP